MFGRGFGKASTGRNRTTYLGERLSSETDFPSLLAAALSGDESAWATVYREYSPPVLRYLRGQGAREPEDLLGEVFVQVVRNLLTFEGGERDFRTWIFVIARNRLTDERRSGGRNLADSVPSDTLTELAGTGHVEDDAMRRLTNEHVMRVLHRLTADQRDVLFLRLFARLTVDEVAHVVGKRPGAVKALQSRGIAAIRREMSK